MKLRIRNLKTKETIKIEISDSSSLQDLKTLISSKLPSSVSQQFINLSLNRNDPLVSSPNESLKSLGLTSGDLLFYEDVLDVALISFPIQSGTPNQKPCKERSDIETGNTSNLAPIGNPNDEIESQARNLEIPSFPLTSEKAEFETGDRSKSAPNVDPVEDTDVLGENFKNPNLDETLIDADAKSWCLETKKSSSVPYLLKRVMSLEKEEIKGNTGYTIAALHAVFLESGFEISRGNGNRLPNNWNSGSSVFSLQYTVPGLSNKNNSKAANLKFSISKNHVIVYGNVQGECDVYRLDLDVSKVLPLLVFLSDTLSKDEEKEIFQFWRTVKDSLCLPLLIDICHSNGLQSPPCFGRLPTELKCMILVLIPGADVAKTACTSSEMRYLCLDDDLWKKKFYEEFGKGNENIFANIGSWRESFKFMWIRRKGYKQSAAYRDGIYMRRYPPSYPPILGPQRFPFVGGDYDRFPAIGGFGHMGPGLGQPRSVFRRNFSPRCDLGSRNDFL